DGVIKIVYFKDGDVLSASTNDRADSNDDILLRAGKVTREHVKQALAKRKESETLGDALLGLGFITRKELTWARRVQVIGILRSVLGWPAGVYAIVPDYLPKREEGTIFPLPPSLLEPSVTEQDRPKFEQARDSGGAVFTKTAGFDDGFRRLGLNEDAEQIVATIDGQRTAAEVASTSGKDVFNVYKLLEALRVLGLVDHRSAVAATAVNYDDFASVGAAAVAAWTVQGVRRGPASGHQRGGRMVRLDVLAGARRACRDSRGDADGTAQGHRAAAASAGVRADAAAGDINHHDHCAAGAHRRG